MKFGKVEPSRDWLKPLPKDHPIIDELGNSSGLDIYLGGTQWGIKEWVGQWYPPGTPQRAFLPAYGKQFACIELNATHYRLFPPSRFEEWRRSVPEGFIFLPKLPQSISHYRRLNNTEEVVADFVEGVRELGSSVGPAFLQMPENFKIEKREDLLRWVDEWPSELGLSIELRHPSWFEDYELLSDLIAYLHAKCIGMVLTDAPGRPDVLHMAVTQPDLFIRYAGWDLHEFDQIRIEQWANRFAEWESKGVKRIFIGIHQPNSLSTPETAIAFSNAIKKASGKIRVHGVPSPLSLF